MTPSCKLVRLESFDSPGPAIAVARWRQRLAHPGEREPSRVFKCRSCGAWHCHVFDDLCRRLTDYDADDWVITVSGQHQRRGDHPDPASRRNNRNLDALNDAIAAAASPKDLDEVARLAASAGIPTGRTGILPAPTPGAEGTP